MESPISDWITLYFLYQIYCYKFDCISIMLCTCEYLHIPLQLQYLIHLIYFLISFLGLINNINICNIHMIIILYIICDTFMYTHTHTNVHATWL